MLKTRGQVFNFCKHFIHVHIIDNTACLSIMVGYTCTIICTNQKSKKAVVYSTLLDPISHSCVILLFPYPWSVSQKYYSVVCGGISRFFQVLFERYVRAKFSPSFNFEVQNASESSFKFCSSGQEKYL